MHIQESTLRHLRWPSSLSREENVLHAFLRANIQELTFHQTNYCSRLQTIRWFRRSDRKLESFLEISQNEFELIGAGARRFPVLERKGGPPAFGWWGKVDSCMLEQGGILLKLWVIICLCIEGGHIGKREFICQSISMEKFGIQVLRFTNKGILSNLYGGMWIHRFGSKE